MGGIALFVTVILAAIYTWLICAAAMMFGYALSPVIVFIVVVLIIVLMSL